MSVLFISSQTTKTPHVRLKECQAANYMINVMCSADVYNNIMCMYMYIYDYLLIQAKFHSPNLVHSKQQTKSSPCWRQILSRLWITVWVSLPRLGCTMCTSSGREQCSSGTGTGQGRHDETWPPRQDERGGAGQEGRAGRWVGVWGECMLYVLGREGGRGGGERDWNCFRLGYWDTCTCMLYINFV